MKSTRGCLVLETGEIYSGQWVGGPAAVGCGEVVFNTSHSGYQEVATDPSYFNQIMVFTAPQQGNYGVSPKFQESKKIWIEGAIAVEMQSSTRDASWQNYLTDAGKPTLSDLDTRKLVIRLRAGGSVWGMMANGEPHDRDWVNEAKRFIADKRREDRDWCYRVSIREAQTIQGEDSRGPKVAVLDFGCKDNIVNELKRRCREVRVFPARTGADEIRSYNPDGILLSNGPGDPMDVQVADETVRSLIGWKYIFGICMGHQILGRAIGSRTYKLKFGHRGANHPIRDELLNRVYVTSQNHGYALDPETLPSEVQVTHTNLNDMTVAGIHWPEKKLLGVQFHPESHPGPHDAEVLFDYFVRQLL